MTDETLKANLSRDRKSVSIHAALFPKSLLATFAFASAAALSSTPEDLRLSPGLPTRER
jgi:hypothetical protein